MTFINLEKENASASSGVKPNDLVVANMRKLLAEEAKNRAAATSSQKAVDPEDLLVANMRKQLGAG